MKVHEPLCFFCKNLTEYPKCHAFPNGIPADIRRGKNLHLAHLPGDHNIVFQSSPNQKYYSSVNKAVNHA